MIHAPTQLGPHALLIDDDPGVRRATRAMLAQFGWQVTEASSGEEGLALLDPQAIDIVLLDVMLPGAGGYAICREITQHPASEHIPVILITALDGAEDQLAGLESGAMEFLTKPVGTQELRARLQAALRIRRSHDRIANLLAQQQEWMRLLVHDLRSPVSVILSNARLCHDHAETALVSESLLDIELAGRRVMRLVDELLALSRREAGEITIRPSPADLHDLIERVLAPLRRLEPERGLRLDAPRGASPARVDVLLIERVVDNLVGNALKYSPPGSPVDVSLAPLAAEPRLEDPGLEDPGTADRPGLAPLQLGPPALRYRIQVRDRGVGVADLDLERLFELGATAEREIDAVQGGLGLYFCRQTIHAHGGQLGLSHRPGGGTIAWLEIPAMAGRAALALSRQHTGSGGRIR